MVEFSIPWAGTIVGDAGPYSDDDWSDMYRKFFSRDRTTQGVLQDYANELEVTSPGALQVEVDTGAAIVDGKFYETDAVVPLAVVAPGAGDQYYTVMLQKNWIGANAQTVRVALYGPVVPPPAAPLYGATQVDGTIWEIPLATVRVHHDNTTVVTDTRAFAKYSDAYPVAGRQGSTTGNTYWGTAGVNNSVPSGNIIKQIGCRNVAIGNGDDSGSAIVTFPIPFSTEPFVIGNTRGTGVMSAAVKCHPNPEFVLAGGVTMEAWAGRLEGSAGAQNVVINWIAIGPKA